MEIGGFARQGLDDDGATLRVAQGGYVASGTSDSGPLRLFSVDGVRWRVDDSTIGATIDCPGHQGTACDMWPIADGWEAFVTEAGVAAPSLWRTDDDVHWVRVRLPVEVARTLVGEAWVAPDGTTLVLLDPSGSGDPTSQTLGVVDAAGAWRQIGYPAECPSTASDLVLAPVVDGSHLWAISDGSVVCTSPDLRGWRSGKLPVPSGIVSWTQTRFGILATGADSDCLCDRPFQLLSNDGLVWTRVGDPVGTAEIADGPAGVIAVGVKQYGADFTAWRLEP